MCLFRCLCQTIAGRRERRFAGAYGSDRLVRVAWFSCHHHGGLSSILGKGGLQERILTGLSTLPLPINLQQAKRCPAGSGNSSHSMRCRMNLRRRFDKRRLDLAHMLGLARVTCPSPCVSPPPPVLLRDSLLRELMPAEDTYQAEVNTLKWIRSCGYTVTLLQP